MFSRRKVRVSFYIDSSLDRALVASTSKLEVIVIVIVIVIASTCPLFPIIKGPNFILILLKVTFSCALFRDPTRARFSLRKTQGHFDSCSYRGANGMTYEQK